MFLNSNQNQKTTNPSYETGACRMFFLKNQTSKFASKASHNFRNLYSRDASNNMDSIHFSARGKSAWFLFCEVALEATNRKGYNVAKFKA